MKNLDHNAFTLSESDILNLTDNQIKGYSEAWNEFIDGGFTVDSYGCQWNMDIEASLSLLTRGKQVDKHYNPTG